METLSGSWQKSSPPNNNKQKHSKHFIHSTLVQVTEKPPSQICALFIYKRFEGYKKHLYSFHIYATYWHLHAVSFSDIELMMGSNTSTNSSHGMADEKPMSHAASGTNVKHFIKWKLYLEVGRKAPPSKTDTW